MPSAPARGGRCRCCYGLRVPFSLCLWPAARHHPVAMPIRWTAEDLEALTDLAGELPWQLVVKEFAQRRPARSSHAMRLKAEELGLSRKPEGKYISTGLIRQLTGYSYDKIYSWIRSGKLNAVSRSNAKNSPQYISRLNLRRFARKHPEQFGGIDQANLTMLFDSEFLASKIVEMNLPKITRETPVLCVETGRRYVSIAEAARREHVDKRGIWSAIQLGSSICGKHYRRVEVR